MRNKLTPIAASVGNIVRSNRACEKCGTCCGNDGS